MRFIIFLFLFFPASASAAAWDVVALIKGDPHVLHLPYNSGTIRMLLDERCGDRRAACVVAVPLSHPKRLEYAGQWYRQCLTALNEARRVGGSPAWIVHDLRAARDEWLKEPRGTVGAEILCEAKPALLPTPMTTPPLPPFKREGNVPKMAEAEPPTSPANKAPPAVVMSPEKFPRRRDTVELLVAVFGESWYALAREEFDGMGGGAAGIEVEPSAALLLSLRVEIGGSQRGGTPYLWVGGMTDVSFPIWEMVKLGGFIRWHHGFLGEEPSRDRLGLGARVVIPRLITDNLGLELMVGVARDLTPAYQVANGRYTDANDLTANLAVGVVWLPLL